MDFMLHRSYKRSALFACGFLLLLMTGLSGLTAREWRQARLDHDLIAAIKRNDADKVHACLERGADPNVCDNARPASFWELLRTQFLRRNPAHQGTAALLIAINSRQDTQQVVHTLLAHGANYNTRGQEGFTPLMYAASRERTDIMKMLIEQGVDVQAHNKIGATALHYAATSLEGTRLLLNSHAEIEARDNSGQTPMMWEADAGNLEAVQLMIDKGADARAIDGNHHTALWHAQHWDQRDVVTILRRAEAKP